MLRSTQRRVWPTVRMSSSVCLSFLTRECLLTVRMLRDEHHCTGLFNYLVSIQHNSCFYTVGGRHATTFSDDHYHICDAVRGRHARAHLR